MYRAYRQKQMAEVPLFVEPDWLAEQLELSSNIRILDASFHMPASKRDAKEEYKQSHIPSALHFNLDECCDKTAEYGEQMLFPPEGFEEFVGKLGISNDTHVVIYDNNADKGIFSAPRAWFTFLVFNHTKISILNGGFPRWCAEGKPTTEGVVEVPVTKYKAEFRAHMVKSYDDVMNNLKSKEFTLLDARPPGRYNGTQPEPNPDIKPGHIPGAVNIPFPQFIDSGAKQVKTPDQIKEVFSKAGIDIAGSEEVVASCGAGLVASFHVLGAYLCGREIPMYDGSWAEWFQRTKDQDLLCDVPE